MSITSLIAGLGTALTAGAAGWLLFLRDQTTDSDTTGERVPPVDVPKGAPSIGARAVEVLSRYVGSHGNGPKGTAGYHRSDLIDKINLGVYGDGKSLIGKPWCARGARYAYEVAAQELGLPPPFAKIKSTLANVSTWKSAPFKPFFISTPKVGAALLLGESHATLIAKVLDDRTALTVEANHADAVANVKRTIRPQDTIVDVEAYIASVQGGPQDLVAGDGFAVLGMEWA